MVSGTGSAPGCRHRRQKPRPGDFVRAWADAPKRVAPLRSLPKASPAAIREQSCWIRTQTLSHRLKCAHSSHQPRQSTLPSLLCAERACGNSSSAVPPVLSSHRYNASHHRHANLYPAGSRHCPSYELLCAQLRWPSCRPRDGADA